MIVVFFGTLITAIFMALSGALMIVGNFYPVVGVLNLAVAALGIYKSFVFEPRATGE